MRVFQNFLPIAYCYLPSDFYEGANINKNEQEGISARLVTPSGLSCYNQLPVCVINLQSIDAGDKC